MLQNERRREQRPPDGHEIDAAGRRLQWRTAVAPLALGLLVLAGVTLAMLRGGNAAPPRTEAPRDAVLSDAAFGPHYDGLVQRRRAAQVPTMMQTMGSRVHFHPLLKVFVNDKPVTVPANIGIDPRAPGMQMAGLHTHDATGTIHVEGVPGARLGQFFAIWGVPFSARRLGRAAATACECGSTGSDRPPSGHSSSPMASESWSASARRRHRGRSEGAFQSR
jgi:hypothetical protein